MKKIIPFLFIANFAFGQGDQLTRDSVIKDLDVLYSLLNEVHPGQLMHCKRSDFENTYDSLKKSITANSSLTEYYCKLQCLVAKVHDGHTWLDNFRVSILLQNNEMFPFSIYKIDDNYFLSRSGHEKYDSLIGIQVKSINGRETEELVKEVSKYLSIEGSNKSSLNNSLQIFPFLYYLISPDSSFTVEVIGDDGKVKSLYLSGIKYQSFRDRTRKIVEPIYYEIRNEGIAVLCVNTFVIDDFKYKKINYKKYFSNIFKDLYRKKINKLIIDVRNNGGGSPEISNELFSYLYHQPYFYFDGVGRKNVKVNKFKIYCTSPAFFREVDTIKTVKEGDLYFQKNGFWWFEEQKPKRNGYNGKLIVLTNGGCYSTTGHFLTLLREYRVGKLAGECSEGSYYSNDGGLFFRLPYSGLLVRIPTAQFKMKTADFIYQAKGICPDIEIPLQREDIKTGFDRQFSEAIKQLNLN